MMKKTKVEEQRFDVFDDWIEQIIVPTAIDGKRVQNQLWTNSDFVIEMPLILIAFRLDFNNTR